MSLANLSEEKSVFVISVKRVRNCWGDKCEPYWEYTSYDNYAGAMSSGYPCFDRLNHAITYDSMKDAEEKFKKWWRTFRSANSNIAERYDLSTLGVREMRLSTLQEKALDWRNID